MKEYTYLGTVEASDTGGLHRIEQRNKFSLGEEIEIMKPDGRNIKARLMDSAPHPKQKLWIDLGQGLDQYDILRRQE